MEVLWLGDAAAHDRAVVGGKAAQLSRLSATELVPPGFVLPALALGHVLTTEDIDPTVPPGALLEHVGAAYGRLARLAGGDDVPVAVRSSALDEDGHLASFAGQHTTFLQVMGVPEIVAAIIRCWQSARSAQALAYRRQQGLSDESVRLAVLVQQMAKADVSAVVFSANPINGRHDEVIVTASWGLGESVVGGTVTPDTFTIRKSDMSIRDQTIATKQKMTVGGPSGSREIDVPRFLRDQASLTDAQAVEIAQLAVRLEAAMGWPVDVECAYAGGQLALLQCRPITTLSGSAR